MQVIGRQVAVGQHRARWQGVVGRKSVERIGQHGNCPVQLLYRSIIEARSEFVEKSEKNVEKRLAHCEEDAEVGSIYLYLQERSQDTFFHPLEHQQGRQCGERSD